MNYDGSQYRGSDIDTVRALRTALSAQGVPDDVVDALISSSEQMVDAYLAGRHRPSELSGGDFAEAAARVVQHLATGRSTAVGKSLPPFDRLRQQFESHSSLDDSLRIHVPRVLQMMYDVRNRRGVGHLPGPVSANEPDAQLLLTCAKWVLAELLRLFHGSSHNEAQAMVDALAVRETPIVQHFEGVRRVIARKPVSVPDAVLVLLGAASTSIHRSELATWVRQPASRVATALIRLDQRSLIHPFPDGRVALTSLGEAEADRLLTELAH